MKKLKIAGFAFCILAVAACAHDSRQEVGSSAAQSWGAAERVVGMGNFYFAGQPDAAGFAQARAHGVEIVIDLRDPKEQQWNGRAAAEEAGLAYYNIVVPGRDDLPFKPERMQQIEQILADNPGRKVLVHCASGSRAAGWFAIHLATQSGYSVDEAIATASELNMMRSSTEAAARAYLEGSSPDE